MLQRGRAYLGVVRDGAQQGRESSKVVEREGIVLGRPVAIRISGQVSGSFVTQEGITDDLLSVMTAMWG